MHVCIHRKSSLSLLMSGLNSMNGNKLFHNRSKRFCARGYLLCNIISFQYFSLKKENYRKVEKNIGCTTDSTHGLEMLGRLKSITLMFYRP